MRTDLLSLSLDDLIDLSNRGLVNRSLKEVEAGILTATIAETTDGSVNVQWSDGVTCCLPNHRVLAEDCCSCNATQICRHLLRSILYYQRLMADAPEGSPQSPSVTPSPESLVPETIVDPALEQGGAEVSPEVPSSLRRGMLQEWDPGEISDALLEPYFKPVEWKRLQEQYAQGQILELSRSAKPTAYFHQWGVTTRFKVPGDVHYVYCSCGEAENKICGHVPLAVWGFRSLREKLPEQSTGLISTEVFEPIASSLLTEMEAILGQLLSLGLTHWSTPLVGRIKRLLNSCEAEGLIWLSELWSDLLQHYTDYKQQNAQFQPSQVRELLMEAECRFRAMQNSQSPVPQLWIRGSNLDRPTTIGATTLVGLGCGVRVGAAAVQLQVYVQDLKSGQVLIIDQSYREQSYREQSQTSEHSVPFAQLALKSGFKRFSLARLGSHQTVIKGGKRLPNHEFRPARNVAASLNPQTFIWENNLRPPLVVDNLQLLQDHLAQCPPPPLRPRRLGDRFQVITIAEVSGVVFSTVDQCILADLKDPQGNPITLRHPYHDRGAEGAEILLTLLQHYPDRLRFVSGQVSQNAQGLVLQPIALILENHQGQRSMLQPWIETRQTWSGLPLQDAQRLSRLTSPHPWDLRSPPSTPQQTLDRYLGELKTLVTDLLMLGLESSDPKLLGQLQHSYDQGRTLGFHQLLMPLETLYTEFRRKVDDPHWQAQRSQAALRDLFLWISFADESGKPLTPEPPAIPSSKHFEN